MPKRVLDGEGLWRSDKLALVEPPGRRAEYANLIPLALANGVFEANPRRIWSAVYAYNRPDISPEEVEQILDEFERVKLLFRWHDPSTGKVWGYWVGIEKPGRLPGKSRWGKNEAVGPHPPSERLLEFVGGATAALHGIQVEANGIRTAADENTRPADETPQVTHSAMDSIGIHTEADGIRQAPNGCIGLGFGLGSGGGSARPFNSVECARMYCDSHSLSGRNNLETVNQVIDQIVAKHSVSCEQALGMLNEATEKRDSKKELRWWLADGGWDKAPKKQTKPVNPVVLTRQALEVNV